MAELIDLVIDFDVAVSLLNYVFLGLSPGSFSTSLLMQDQESAYARAHAILREPAVSGVIENMLPLAETIPVICRDDMDAWTRHGGLCGAADVTRDTFQRQLVMGELSYRLKRSFSHPFSSVLRDGTEKVLKGRKIFATYDDHPLRFGLREI